MYHITRDGTVKRNPLTKEQKAFLRAVKYGTMRHHGEHTAQVRPSLGSDDILERRNADDEWYMRTRGR